MRKSTFISDRHRHMLLCVAALASLLTASFNWPLSEHRLTATFAESRWDHFHSGLDMVNADGAVKPADDGRLLYFWDRSLYPLENYPGGGNFKVLSHSGGRFTIYMHLDDSPGFEAMNLKASRMATMGNTGHSFSKHLHFSIYDWKKGISPNPLSLLSVSEDKKAPEIGEMAIRIGDKIVIIKDKADIRLTRHYPLLVMIRDTIQGHERLGLFRLKARFNGKDAVNLLFNEIKYERSGAKVAGRSFGSLFDEKGYYKIEGVEYKAGENTLDISAEDFAGNKSEKTFSFTVKLDLPGNK